MCLYWVILTLSNFVAWGVCSSGEIGQTDLGAQKAGDIVSGCPTQNHGI